MEDSASPPPVSAPRAARGTGFAVTFWPLCSLALRDERASCGHQPAGEGIAEGEVEVVVEADSNDEIGRLARTFRGAIADLQQMAAAASEIAAGNLTVEIRPRSDRDALGGSFAEMRTRIAEMLRQISHSSLAVGTASHQIAQSGQQAGVAVSEIAGATASAVQGAETQVRVGVPLAAQADPPHSRSCPGNTPTHQSGTRPAGTRQRPTKAGRRAGLRARDAPSSST